MCDYMSLVAMTVWASAVAGILFHSIAIRAKSVQIGVVSFVAYCLSACVLIASGFGLCVLMWMNSSGEIQCV